MRSLSIFSFFQFVQKKDCTQATITTTHEQAIRKIDQLRLVEASLVMIILVLRNTHKADIHGRQINKHVF